MSTGFNKFKTRYIFVDFWLLSNLIAITGLFLFGSLEKLTQPFSVTGNIVHIILFFSTCGSIIYRLSFCQIELKYLVGSLNLNQIPWIVLWIVFYGIHTFTEGIQYLEYYFGELIYPQLLQSSLNLLKETNYDSANLLTQFAQYFLLMFVLVIVAPITEEFIFRGIFLHRWAIKWSVLWSIILSSLLFGAVHLDAFWFSRGVGSVFIALFYIQTKSLLVPIILHALNNALAFIEILFNNFSPATVEEVNITQQYLWYGLINILLAIPILVYFLKFPKNVAEFPYFYNYHKAELSQKKQKKD